MNVREDKILNASYLFTQKEVKHDIYYHESKPKKRLNMTFTNMNSNLT